MVSPESPEPSMVSPEPEPEFSMVSPEPNSVRQGLDGRWGWRSTLQGGITVVRGGAQYLQEYRQRMQEMSGDRQYRARQVAERLRIRR